MALEDGEQVPPPISPDTKEFRLSHVSRCGDWNRTTLNQILHRGVAADVRLHNQPIDLV